MLLMIKLFSVYQKAHLEDIRIRLVFNHVNTPNFHVDMQNFNVHQFYECYK